MYLANLYFVHYFSSRHHPTPGFCKVAKTLAYNYSNVYFKFKKPLSVNDSYNVMVCGNAKFCLPARFVAWCINPPNVYAE